MRSAITVLGLCALIAIAVYGYRASSSTAEQDAPTPPRTGMLSAPTITHAGNWVCLYDAYVDIENHVVTSVVMAGDRAPSVGDQIGETLLEAFERDLPPAMWEEFLASGEELPERYSQIGAEVYYDEDGTLRIGCHPDSPGRDSLQPESFPAGWPPRVATDLVEIHYPPEVRDQFPEFEIVEELGITPSIPLAESGRLQQGSIGHGLRIEDANGEPLDEPQGFGFYVVCEYDARVDYDQDGVVSWVYATGLGTTVEAGETVRGELRVGDGNVYRDRSGDLRPGCDPEASVVEYSGSHPSAPDPREP